MFEGTAPRASSLQPTLTTDTFVNCSWVGEYCEEIWLRYHCSEAAVKYAQNLEECHPGGEIKSSMKYCALLIQIVLCYCLVQNIFVTSSGQYKCGDKGEWCHHVTTPHPGVTLSQETPAHRQHHHSNTHTSQTFHLSTVQNMFKAKIPIWMINLKALRL